MKTIERDKKYIYFKAQTGMTEILDEYGSATGQYQPIYSNLATVLMSESANAGNASMNAFGIGTNYSKILVSSLLNLNIGTETVMWVGFGKVADFSTGTSYIAGDKVIYQHTMYTCKNSHTGAWNSSDFTETPYNYIVVGVAKSINFVKYAIREVQVNG